MQPGMQPGWQPGGLGFIPPQPQGGYGMQGQPPYPQIYGTEPEPEPPPPVTRPGHKRLSNRVFVAPSDATTADILAESLE